MLQLKTTFVRAALSAGCLVATVGCHADEGPAPASKYDSSMPDTAGMSKDDLIAKGKAMVDKGQAVKDAAAAMKPGDTTDNLTPDELMMKGDEMMKNGKAMMDMGMTK